MVVVLVSQVALVPLVGLVLRAGQVAVNHRGHRNHPLGLVALVGLVALDRQGDSLRRTLGLLQLVAPLLLYVRVDLVGLEYRVRPEYRVGLEYPAARSHLCYHGHPFHL